jgi:hypothetical protein
LALGFGLLALRTHGGWTTEFRAHRATFTVLAPARRAASVAKLHVYLGHVSLANRAGSPLLSVPIATCSGISALPTRVDRPSEFHGHRALFIDLAPARRGEISVFHVACSAGPCGPAPPAATARDFNTEFSPATFPGQPRFCGLVGQSEFQSGADFGPSSHFSILISRFRTLRLFGGWIQIWESSATVPRGI